MPNRIINDSHTLPLIGAKRKSLIIKIQQSQRQKGDFCPNGRTVRKWPLWLLLLLPWHDSMTSWWYQLSSQSIESIPYCPKSIKAPKQLLGSISASTTWMHRMGLGSSGIYMPFWELITPCIKPVRFSLNLLACTLVIGPVFICTRSAP